MLTAVYIHNEQPRTIEYGTPNSKTCQFAEFKSWSQGVVTVLSPVLERNCSRIVQGDKEEIARVKTQKAQWKNSLSYEKLLLLTANCSWVTDYFHGNLYITRLEQSFPLAYSFVVHNSPQQFLRLLRLLYRPANAYCIHVDIKSTPTFKNITSNIATCLENVFIASKLVSVDWGRPTLLEAQMSCASDLVKMGSKQSQQTRWRYMINLCGKELPLYSTHDMVSKLTKLNGSSVVRVRGGTDKDRLRLRNKTVPFNLTFYKSSAYTALSYNFTNFLTTNSTARELYDFFMECGMPEEHFYSTLSMMPGVPGGFNPSIPAQDRIRMVRVFWSWSKQLKGKCDGGIVHGICIVTSSELKEVIAAQHSDETVAMFHNKYFMGDDHTIMDCMEERLVASNKREFEADCALTND